MNFKNILASLICFALAGCASYNALPLATLSSHAIDVNQPKERSNVVAAAKALSQAECIRYFDRNIIEKGYLPVQLYIENNTDKSYVFSLNRVSLSLARPEEVAEKVHTSTVARVMWYSAGAVFLCFPLAIPAIVDGIKSARANEALDVDFDAKGAKDQIIAMHSHLNKVLFVPRNAFDPSFTVTLVDAETHSTKTLKVFATES